MTTVLKNIFFIALNWLLTTFATTKTRLSSNFIRNCVWQDFVTVKKYKLISIGNGQLSTRTRVILLWALPVGLRLNRAAPGIMHEIFVDFDEVPPLMLSSSGTGSCVYESPACRHSTGSNVSRGVLLGEESLSAVETDVSLWTPDASTSQVNLVHPAYNLHHLHHANSGSLWTQMKYLGGSEGLSRHLHDWVADSWSSNIDDLLPTSETYKWMTVKRSRTKPGTCVHYDFVLCIYIPLI